MVPPAQIWTGLLPILAAAIAACLLILVSAFWRNPRGLSVLAFLLVVPGCGGAVAALWARGGSSNPHLLLSCDRLALFFHALFLAAAGLVILLSPAYFAAKGSRRPEYYGLVVLSVVGMMVLASATNLITFYLGLEIMSISFYILAGFLRDCEMSVEASLKYFLLGSFSSAFLLFGMALLFGTTGYLNYADLGATFIEKGIRFGPSMLTLGFFLFLVGLFFKLSLIPFHFWAPDVYQGSPTPVTALMAVGGKAAAVAAAVRIYLVAFSQSPLLSTKWFALFSAIGLLTIFVGSMIALTQRHMKRLLAYSSVVHAGFLALGLGSLTLMPAPTAHAVLEAVLFYLGAYLFMNIGAFAVASTMEQPGSTDATIRSFSGLGQTSPVLAALFSFLMFALAGIPLTAGFLGKFFVFGALVKGHQLTVAVCGFLGAVIATYYYLRVVVALYFPPAGDEVGTAPKVPFLTWVVIGIAAAATLVLGIFPGPLVRIIAGLWIG